MCWIYVKKAGNEVNEKYMDKAQKFNEDGYGVAWFEDGFVKTYKSFDYDKFKGVCKALESHTLVIHLRYATKGDKSYDNIHPFDTPTGVMFHNGTMFKLPSDTKMSDSQVLAELLNECTYKKIADIEPLITPYIEGKINRLVFFEDSGEVTIMNEQLGVWEKGDWYSNDYHLKKDGWCRDGSTCSPIKKELPTPNKKDAKGGIVAKVFVYGTLKKGFHNHSLLENAKFLGKAETADLWTMVPNATRTFPYVLRQDDIFGDFISGEVYGVTASELERLDRLEGVPSHYKRQVVEIEYMSGIVEEVIMYVKTFVPEGVYEEKDYIAEWTAA